MESKLESLMPNVATGIDVRNALKSLFHLSCGPARAVVGLSWTLVPENLVFRSVLKALANGDHGTIMEKDVLTKTTRHNVLRALHGIAAIHSPVALAKSVSGAACGFHSSLRVVPCDLLVWFV
jgi:hypothetical protein